MSLVYTQTATSPSPTLAPPVLGLPKCPRPCFLCHRYLVFYPPGKDSWFLLGSCSGWNLGNVQVTFVHSLILSTRPSIYLFNRDLPSE